MVTNKALLAGVLASCASFTVAQSPSGFSPSTQASLKVQYGSLNIIPNTLEPQASVASQPSVAANATDSGTYILAMTDLSILDKQVTMNTSMQGTLAQGLGSGRTTRLHWWQGNVTQSTNGTLVYNNQTSPPAAPYEGPAPPAGDIAHTYVIWLFPQPSNFSVPDSTIAALQNPEAMARYNYSITALVQQVGNPIAANYFRVQNTSNASTSATSSAPVASQTANAADKSVGEIAGGAVVAIVGALGFMML